MVLQNCTLYLDLLRQDKKALWVTCRILHCEDGGLTCNVWETFTCQQVIIYSGDKILLTLSMCHKAMWEDIILNIFAICFKQALNATIKHNLFSNNSTWPSFKLKLAVNTQYNIPVGHILLEKICLMKYHSGMG